MMQADGAFLCLGQASAGLPTGFLSEVDIGQVRHAKATWDFSNHSRKGDLKLTCGKIPSPSLCTEKGGHESWSVYCAATSDYHEMYEYKWMQMQKYYVHDSARQISTLLFPTCEMGWKWL